MKITGPLFKWFGSKWLSSRLLPEPTEDTIFEPFAGGAGYSLHHFEKNVLLCEKDGHLRALWYWLVGEATDRDIREIPCCLPEGVDIRTIGLSRGQQLLLKNWQRTNNVGDCWTISTWGNKPGQWTENTRSRVADQVGLIKHWQVSEETNGLALLSIPRELNGRGVTFFVDPPYQYNYQYRSGQRIDYAALGELCRRIPGQVIVCEAACPKTGAVPNWLPFQEFGSRVTSRRKTGEHHHSRELIWVRSVERVG